MTKGEMGEHSPVEGGSAAVEPQGRLLARIAATAIRIAPIAVVAIGAWLRLGNLGQAELFRDEAASWMLARYPVVTIIQRNMDKTYPPFYPLFMHFWMAVVGTGEAALREPSAIAGIVTVVVAWRWSSQALGRTAGLMTAAVVAVSTLLIGNSREARMYSLETMFATVAWWLAWRLAVDGRSLGGRSWRWVAATVIGLAVAVAGEVWTLAFGIPTAGLQFLFVLVALAVSWRMSRKGERVTRGPLLAAAAIVAGGASLSVWLPRLLGVATNGQAFWTAKPDLVSLRDSFFFFMGVSGLADLSALAPIAVIVVVVAGLVGFCAPGRLGLTDRSNDGVEEVLRVRLFGVAVVLGIGLVGAIWIYSQVNPIYDSRYLGAAAVPLAALIGAGLVAIIRGIRIRPVGSAAGLVLAVAILGPMTAGALLNVDRLNTNWNGDPASETAQQLATLVKPGDVVLTVDAQTYVPLDYYLDQTAAGKAVLGRMFDWSQPNWSPYIGASLVESGRVVDAGLVAKVGWRAALPGLSATGTIWLVTIANGNDSELGFDPLDNGQLVERAGGTIFVTPPQGNWGQIRPLEIAAAATGGDLKARSVCIVAGVAALPVLQVRAL